MLIADKWPPHECQKRTIRAMSTEAANAITILTRSRHMAICYWCPPVSTPPLQKFFALLRLTFHHASVANATQSATIINRPAPNEASSGERNTS
jgi:hypothetical protein